MLSHYDKKKNVTGNWETSFISLISEQIMSQRHLKMAQTYGI